MPIFLNFIYTALFPPAHLNLSVSGDAKIEPRTTAKFALTIRAFSYQGTAHPVTLVHNKQHLLASFLSFLC
jgi:hypothetical protein